MTNQNNIEKLFRDSFENFEPEVNPQLWANVQAGLSAAGKGAAGTAAKFALGKIIGSATAAVALVAAGVWYFSETENMKTSSSSVKPASVAENKVPVNNNEEPQLAAETNEQNNSSKEISINRRQEKPVQQSKSNPENITGQETVSAGNFETTQEEKAADNVSQPVAKSNPNRNKNSKTISRANNILSPFAPEKEEKVENKEETSAGETASFPADETLSEVAEQSKAMLIIPNIVTPNGDGYTDYFQLAHLENVSRISVTVFDVKGVKMSEWQTLEGKWDGKLPNGMDAPEGYYMVVAKAWDAEGRENIIKGAVHLIR